MNDVAKQSISDRLQIALSKESLTKVKAGELLGIKPQYLSMVLHVEQWNKFSATTWDILQKWVNSGQDIVEYSEKHGKVLPEKEEIKINVNAEVMQKESLIKIRPEVKEVREVELKKKQERLTHGQMVDLLLEEREKLKQKIEAIDTLLKHYIS